MARGRQWLEGTKILEHKCPDCGKELSSTAASCPGCGAAKPEAGWPKTFYSRHPLIAGIIGLATLALGAYAMLVVFTLVSASCSTH
ncbi:zinc-ribbon domain-containing protein [Paraburkholderia tagetis]|uniref:zinc-ribbon domain-containing protein n=1 Tax=Paraburkholderia tagetis TaxID=2913261 RepID=UPI003B75B3E9